MTRLSRRDFLSLFGAAFAAGSLTACEGAAAARKKQRKPPTVPEMERMREDIRRALMLMIDRVHIVDNITQRGEIVANTFVCRGIQEPDGADFTSRSGSGDGRGYFDPTQATLEANYNAAIKLLRMYYDYDEASGVFTNFPALTYVHEVNDTQRAIGEYLQSVFGPLGITINMEEQDAATLVQTRGEGSFQITFDTRVLDYPDPLRMLNQWTVGAGGNDAQFGRGTYESLACYDLDLTGYGSDVRVEQGTWAQTYDALIDTISHTTDQNVRFQLLHLAEDLVMNTGCVWPLYYPVVAYMRSRELTGHYATSLGLHNFRGTLFRNAGTGISVCMGPEPDTLDPSFVATTHGATIVSHLFSGLARWVMAPDGTLQLQPDCAEALVEGVQNPDGTVKYTYVLRKGLKWTDEKPVTAAQFAYGWSRAASAAPGNVYADALQVIMRNEDQSLAIRAVDDRTLEVTTTSLIPYWNQLLTMPTLMPVRDDIAVDTAWNTKPETFVSNGAYMMSAWEHGGVVRMVKRDLYWDAAGTTMQQIDFNLTDDAAACLANFESGAWQLVTNIPPTEVARMRADRADEYVVAPAAGTTFLCWNVNTDILPPQE